MRRGHAKGSRMGVLIKKPRIAAQQMIFSVPDINLWWVETRMLEIFAKPRSRTYLANASAGGKAQVVIICTAVSL